MMTEARISKKKIAEKLDEVKKQRVLHELAAMDLEAAAIVTLVCTLNEAKDLGEAQTRLLLILPVALATIAFRIISKAIAERQLEIVYQENIQRK